MFPDNNAVPPVDAAYQSTTAPVVAVTDKLTMPVPQREPFTGIDGAAGAVFTDAVIALLVATEETHAAFEVILQRMRSPVAKFVPAIPV